MDNIWVVYTIYIDANHIHHVGGWPSLEKATRKVRELLLREIEEDKISYEDWLADKIGEYHEEIDVEDFLRGKDAPDHRKEYFDKMTLLLDQQMDGWTPGYTIKNIQARRTKKGIIPAHTIKTPKMLEFAWGRHTYHVVEMPFYR